MGINIQNDGMRIMKEQSELIQSPRYTTYSDLTSHSGHQFSINNSEYSWHA